MKTIAPAKSIIAVFFTLLLCILKQESKVISDDINDILFMKNVALQFLVLQELYIFKRSSQVMGCQIDFDKKILTGNFPKDEIDLAVNVFNATVVVA